MFIGLAIIVGGLGFLMILERLYPDQPLTPVPGWWKRVLLINMYQLLVVVVGMYTWEEWLPDAHLFQLRHYVNPMVGGLIAYLIHTWLFYWFHRARHNVYFLWLWFHQLHHSAQRIETITSFYKSPQEILVDSILMTTLVYPILGLSKESTLWLSGCAAFGEYFYHMNIKTPTWIGYFIQRPESHRIHHLRKKRDHSLNYADLPIWDILGGTFENPKEMTKPTGFPPDSEIRVKEMILGRDVLLSDKKKTRQVYRERYRWLTLISIIWILLGFSQSAGYVFNLPHLRAFAFSTVASPLPLVFSVAPNGIETFSTSFHIQIYQKDMNGIQDEQMIREAKLTPELYGQMNDKPYNLRNAYGVLFSHGPFFQDEKLIFLRDQVFQHVFCGDGALSKSFDLPKNFTRIFIQIQSNMNKEYFEKSKRENHWTLHIQCQD